MNAYPKKPTIGLLGGIASGKSTVASAFQDLGCAIINADLLAHKALEEGTIQQAIREELGSEALAEDGSVDRAALGRLVFQDAGRLSRLNNLLHPWILEKCQTQLNEHLTNPAIPAVVLDMPLLLEVQWDALCDYIVFVECSKETRLQRAKKRGLNPENLAQREIFQISLDKKAYRADNILINNSDLSSLVRQVTEIFENVINK
ncbi:MAG: dephospho-CoA kinase [Planctomycetes bacterium]|nr:dephospho-CoA kinase [Planctomycetota bacterium]